MGANPNDELKMVLILTRHGVRSPTHPAELDAYSNRPWPTWTDKPGYLTQHGAKLMRQYGQYYRRRYAAAASLPAEGCPPVSEVYVWADVDQRTRATGRALLDGFAPGCSIQVGSTAGDVDRLFDPVPGTGHVDAQRSKASLTGTVGGDPNSLREAYAKEFAALDAVLGCLAPATCKKISSVPSAITSEGDGGLADLSGGIDLASSAVGNLFLEYVDGHNTVGWGRVDRSRLLDLTKIRTLESRLVHGDPYTAMVHSSNMLAHISEILTQGSTGYKTGQNPVPPASRIVMLVGHDTQLSEIAGMLRLSWLVPNYQLNDTPPGGALLFEVHKPSNSIDEPFLRAFYTAQSMDDMRAGDGTRPKDVPVYIPGCPALDCPISTFSKIVDSAVDRSFVAPWN